MSARVDAWMRKRGAEGWIIAGGTRRLALAETWREVVARYGDESPAALGCLLALVREAWGMPPIDREEWLDADGATWCRVVIYASADGESLDFEDSTELEALVAALLAAPPSVQGTVKP